jgi:hypothetical protein
VVVLQGVGYVRHVVVDPGRRVRSRLVDPSAPADAGVGFAAYDPHFPGAFPFRVARATLAAPLLAAIRPYERPGAQYMQLVSEDEGLTAVLRAAGAIVRLTALHMAGALPAA